MKKICAVVLMFCMLFSCAYAVDTLQSNERYPFVSCGPFWFVIPEGFTLEHSANGSPYYLNKTTSEEFTVDFLKEDLSYFISENEEDTLQIPETICMQSFGDEFWAGSLYAEKSGGCYKVGSLIKYDPVSFGIGALCPEGFLIILISPANTSSGMDLAHGIFKTISYQEYDRKFQEYE